MTTSVIYRALPVGLWLAGSVFFCAPAQAQHTSEIGIGLGGTSYRGELAPQYDLLNNRPAFTVFYRRDVSVPITLRGAITGGFLRAADADVTSDQGSPPPLSAYRQASMSGNIIEASAVVEYNFLDFHNRENKHHYTPYLFAGLAGFFANTSTSTANSDLPANFSQGGSMAGISIPAGVGFKLALTEHFNLGLEVGVRKTFTDDLDHLGYNQDPALVNPHDQDWYYYNGVSLSYTFYSILCPKQYQKQPRLLGNKR